MEAGWKLVRPHNAWKFNKLSWKLVEAPALSGGLDKEVASALQFADVVLARGLGMGLSRDQIASIHLYTQDSSLYGGLNGALGGWGPGGRTAVAHYTHYIKVALSGLRLLPKVETTVYRGVRDVSLKTLLNGQDIHGILRWWAFTSTTGTSDVLRDPTFFGIGEGHGDRVVFKIKIKTGVRISSFSDLGSNADDYLTPFGVEAPLNEDEIVLLPGTRFKIDAINTYTNNVTEIEMHELVAGGGATAAGASTVGCRVRRPWPSRSFPATAATVSAHAIIGCRVR